MARLRVNRRGGGSRETGVSLRTFSFSKPVQRTDVSRQLDSADEYGQTLSSNSFRQTIGTPYSISSLRHLLSISNALPQCIEAMVTNVAGYGWEIVQADPKVPVDEDERQILQSFIDWANSDESLASIHQKVVRGREAIGFTFIEFVRDITNNVSLVRYAEPDFVRLRPKDPTLVAVTYDIARGPRTQRVTELKKFRTYVQTIGGETVYFKEYGDPRILHRVTGEFESEEHPVPLEDRATELYHFRFDTPDPYGVPRWISQTTSVMGSRESEEVNLNYFEDNTVPPAIISVAGGRITTQSFNELQKALSSGGFGKDRQHKILLIEAVPEKESLDDKGSVSLRVERLADQRPSDSLFGGYDKDNRAKVRSSFRLPPTLIGDSQDATYATARVSTFIAEIQVFQPERRAYDEIYNKKIVSSDYGLKLKTVALRSKAPQITDSESLMKALTALNVMGAVTPRTSIDAANRVMQTELPQYPVQGEEGWEEWMDKPIIFVTKGTASQEGQAQKDGQIKQIEDTGGVKPPRNGDQ